MSDEFPRLMWQHEYNRQWILYTYEEIIAINKAVQKKQKTVILPSNDATKRLIINFEKMIQKNEVSGLEQHVRCLLFNDVHICWSWKDDRDCWICYAPRIAFFLEVAHKKRMECVTITMKNDYEVNLQKLIKVNKQTQFVHTVTREIVTVKYSRDNQSNFLKMLEDDISCRKVIVKKAEGDINSLQEYAFDLPISAQETDNSANEVLEAPKEIIAALSAQAQASTSTRNLPFAAVDPECPEASDHIVFSEDKDLYSATLNFTSLQDNSNKFFIIQLLKHNNKNEYAVWFHWGRVGYKGQCNLINCGSNLKEAKSVFEKKFYDKTHNYWSERNKFQRVPSKYDLVHVELASEALKLLPSADTKLDIRIQSLLQIICSKKTLEAAVEDLGYDLSNIAVGKITVRQILDGFAALKEISNLIKSKGSGEALLQANNNFYTKIPHNAGKKTPPFLHTMDQLKEQLKMLEDLSNICFGIDVLNSTADGSENIMDKYYSCLECDLIPLEPTSQEFKALCKCLLETHGPTHPSYTMTLIDAFKCVKHIQESSFLDFGDKKLLWHGSRVSNWIGILKKGLQIAPCEAPSTGYMFGKGIYFADTSSKSANYCYATRKKNEGLLLLSEVSLGNALSVTEGDDFSKLPTGYHSVFGIGKFRPQKFEVTALSSEASVPCGPLEENPDQDLTLNYNEYVVYNVHQVKMKYLLKIRFNF